MFFSIAHYKKAILINQCTYIANIGYANGINTNSVMKELCRNILKRLQKSSRIYIYVRSQLLSLRYFGGDNENISKKF